VGKMIVTFKEFCEDDTIAEVMSRQARIKRGIAMRRMKSRLVKKRKIAAKKRATPEVLKKRARKAARNKLAGKILKGKDLSKLSFVDKERLEKKLAKKRGAIERIATKLMPTIRQRERDRFRSMIKKRSGSKDD
jgi:hypothetical protein